MTSLKSLSGKNDAYKYLVIGHCGLFHNWPITKVQTNINTQGTTISYDLLDLDKAVKGIWQYIFILAYRQEHLK